MKRKLKIIVFPLFSILVLLLIFIFIVNHKNNRPIKRNIVNDPDINLSDNKKLSGGEDIWRLTYYEYSPLTFQKYSQIIESNEPFTLVSVKYRFNPTPDDRNPEGIKSLMLSGGLHFRTKYFNEIAEIEGDLMIVTQDSNYYEKIFSLSDFDWILSYLEANNQYFFDGSEYEGLDIPYITDYSFMKNEKYQFTFAIFDPIFVAPSYTSEHLPAWAISKCMETPDPILQGLIDILETHFISQFE